MRKAGSASVITDTEHNDMSAHMAERGAARPGAPHRAFAPELYREPGALRDS
jgi:hypothetical protein